MSVHFANDVVTVHHGDCVDVLGELPDASVDAVCTDPPYGLEFMGREWDSFRPSASRLRTRVDGRTNPAEGKSVTTTPEAYVAGAPYQQWCETWAAECLRVLKPGGHLLAFGGTRTVHRLTCAIEDAGFEIRDGIDWLYGTGFPKSLDVSKAIDKTGGRSPAAQAAVLREARARAGLTREQVAEAVGCKASSVGNWEDGRARATGLDVEHITPSPAYRSKLADLLGYTADERAITGTETDRRDDGSVYGLGHSGVRYGAPTTVAAERWVGWGTALKPAREPIVVARRRPAGTIAENVLAHGVGALNIGACRLESSGGSRRREGELSWNCRYTSQGATNFAALPGVRGGDPDGRWPTNVVLSHAATPDGVDLCIDGCVPDCPVAELDAQSGTLRSGVLAPHHNAKVSANGSMSGGNYANRIKGTFGGDEGGASRFFPVFRYEAKAGSTERPRDGETAHPTVKPLELMRWLVRLVTPPGGTVLEPFAGSGTTAEACVLEGFRCIAIEREAAYLPLIVARLSKPLQPALDIFGGAA